MQGSRGGGGRIAGDCVSGWAPHKADGVCCRGAANMVPFCTCGEEHAGMMQSNSSKGITEEPELTTLESSKRNSNFLSLHASIILIPVQRAVRA